MKTIKQFCSDHRACQEGQEWSLANCKDMLEVWNTVKPTWLFWLATRPGVLTERELRLFAVYCARSVQHLLTDPRSIMAIDVAERYANGEATEKELDTACDAARDAACDAAWDAACDAAAWVAACGAARVVARVAACDAAAWVAARDAACDAARVAARVTVRGAARVAQTEWLRNHTQPNFS